MVKYSIDLFSAEVNPLELQEICRNVIRSTLRDQAKVEYPDITIRKRKAYTGRRRKLFHDIIIPIDGDNSDEEESAGANLLRRGNFRLLLSGYGSSPDLRIHREPYGKLWLLNIKSIT